MLLGLLHTRWYARAAALLALLGLPGAVLAQIHHDLQVALDPQSRQITVTDRIRLPAPPSGPVAFQLHAGLAPQIQGSGAKLRRIGSAQAGAGSSMDPVLPGTVPLERFEVDLPTDTREFTVLYAGEIHHPVEQVGEEYARSFGVSPGIVSPQGVMLAGSSRWYPAIRGALLTFRLQVQLPPGWRSVSQGRRVEREERPQDAVDSWATDKPQEEIYLVAAEFREYQQDAGTTDAMVFLHEPDDALAQKYLNATGQYLQMYAQLLGPYAYAKFALVENFWETGYGMPSFTLLGPRVIRFPFILHSSYPHEILHNWWGNGVYVDYASGNWAEGLTSYLADHLIREQRGQAVGYRRSTLQNYTDYVQEQKDFALTEFRGRHSSATQAVGYGKTLMLFHMLRQKLGDREFIAGLRRLYDEHRFRVASFADVEAAFASVTDTPLDAFFAQWVNRAGAPSLRVRDATAAGTTDGYRLSAVIEQLQTGPAYRLRLPVAVHMEGLEKAYQTHVDIEGKEHRLQLVLPARPTRLDVDPEFDVFRRLDRDEIPPAVSQAFGAEAVLILLPSAAPDDVRASLRKLARSWQKGRAAEVEIRLDNEVDELPSNRAVWLFGWDNRFRSALAEALSDYAYVDHKEDALEIDGNALQRDRHSVVVLARNPADAEQALGWLATDNVAAMPGLGRKLPHYGKYSYLAFAGDEPSNTLKGQWPVVSSPLSLAVEQGDGRSASAARGQLAPRRALAELPPVFSRQRMLADIIHLAGDAMAGRGLGSTELDRAARYLADQFRTIGLRPGGDGDRDFFQTWHTSIGTPPRPIVAKNVIGVLPGRNPALAGQSIVVGAHYDHLGRGWPDVHQGDEGKVHPGADDNASGIAVMLELARFFTQRPPPERTIVFVAFTGEEADRLGSAHYVETSERYPVDQIMAMVNLDTVGRLGDRPVLVLGADSAREWVHIFRGAGFVTGVPVQAVADDYGSSDQASFLEAGVPAVQLFSGPHPDFHRPSDTVDKIDSAGLTKIAAVLKEAIEYLASRPEPLSAQVATAAGDPRVAQGGRRVTFGTVPDFTFGGPGVRLSGVTPGTPAERAGLREGDVIVAINDDTITDLRDFGALLRELQPDDPVAVRFMRKGQAQSIIARVVAR